MSCNANLEPPNYCTQITSNPDISGVGVRSAIYAQALLSMCVASFMPGHEKAFRDTCRNSYVVAGSLLVASLLAWSADQLSLFDALVVLVLTTLMTAFVTVNGPYIRTLGLSINFACLLFTSFWCYWGLQLWSNPSTFGLPPDSRNCSANQETQFVVLGRNVSATNHGLRGFALFIFSIGFISALWALWSTGGWALKYAVVGAQTSKDNAASEYARQLIRQGTQKQYVNRFGGVIGLIYMIVTTELMVTRNSDVRETLEQWSFGQTLALIMLAQQLMDCITYAREWHQVQKEEQRRMHAYPYA